MDIPVNISVDWKISVVIQRGEELRTLDIEELSRYGIKCSLSPGENRKEEYRFMPLSFDSGSTKWHLQELRWHFKQLQLPGDDDVLYLPDKGGARWKDPARLLFEELKYSIGKWRDRQLCLRESGLLDPQKLDAQENSVAVRCSMPFFSYCSSQGSVSAFIFDKGFETTRLRVGAKRGQHGIDLELSKEFNRDVTCWSCTLVLGEHSGDWHQDCQLYKEFYDSLGLGIREAVPLLSGVHAHYDLRWQDGTIHKKYADLPRLADEAKADGFDALVFGGWNEGGFDNNYPGFRPDPLLGGEEELIKAVDAIHAKGMKVLFYVNGFSYDRSRQEFEKEGLPCAVRFADGSTRDVRWGSKVLTGMCMGSARWRAIVCDNVRYVCEVLKADGVYLDQFNVIPPRCYGEGHDHSRSAAAGIFEAFREVRTVAGEDKIFITEHPLDSLNASVDYQDLETVWNNQALTFPELFCYTFPEAGRMDLLIQKPWPCTDPEIEGRHLIKNYDRLFLTGTKLWCYGHASQAPGFGEHFRLGQKLRKEHEELFCKGIYRHTDHIASVPSGVEAAWYDLPGTKAAIVIANTTGAEGTLTLEDERKVDFCSSALQVIYL